MFIIEVIVPPCLYEYTEKWNVFTEKSVRRRCVLEFGAQHFENAMAMALNDALPATADKAAHCIDNEKVSQKSKDCAGNWKTFL